MCMMSACVCVRHYMCVEIRGQLPSTLFETGLLFSHVFARLPGILASRESPVSAFHLAVRALGLQIAPTTPGIYMASGDLNSDSHACTTVTFPTKSSPWPWRAFLYQNTYYIVLLDCISRMQLHWALWVPEFRISCLFPYCLQQLVLYLDPQNKWMNDAKHLGEVGSFIRI